MAVVAARIIVTPDSSAPYKVVLEQDDGSIVEQQVGTIREGEEFIRLHIPPEPRDIAREWQGPPSTSK